MQKETFQYRPDGDIPEIIPHKLAKRIVCEARRVSRYHGATEEEYVLEWANYYANKYGISVDECLIQYADKLYRVARKKYQQDKPLIDRYLYSYDKETWTTTYVDQQENIEVQLTREYVSSQPITEQGVFSGLSDDRCIGIIIYHSGKHESEAFFVAKQSAYDETMDEVLTKNNVKFQVEESDWADGMSAYTTCSIYTYTKHGQARFAYQYTQRYDIDGYVSHIIIFEKAKPSRLELLSHA